MTAAVEDSPAVVPVVAIEETTTIEANATLEIITTTETLESAPNSECTDLVITPAARLISISAEHPIITELRELANGIETVLIWGIAVLRSIIRFSTPYLVRAGSIALRAAVYGVVMFRISLLPKILLIAYQLGDFGNDDRPPIN